MSVLLASLPLVSCIPYPHKETFVPGVRGVITEKGLPVAGAEFFIGGFEVSGAHCVSARRSATTAMDGSFVIASDRREVVMYDIINGRYGVRGAPDLCVRVRNKTIFSGSFDYSVYDDVTFIVNCSIPEGVEDDSRGRPGDAIPYSICKSNLVINSGS